MYRLIIFYTRRVHFGHFGRKCTPWVPFILFRYTWAIMRENMAAGGVLLSAGTVWPFGAKMYRLGVFYSQPVAQQYFFLIWYILAISGKYGPVRSCLFSVQHCRQF